LVKSFGGCKGSVAFAAEWIIGSGNYPDSMVKFTTSDLQAEKRRKDQCLGI
jgi:hypothetical protein